MSVNKVFLVGRLGKDPELRYANSGIAIVNFSLATSERIKKGENWEDKTEWHNIVIFGKQAENCEKFLQKGAQVFIEGKIQTSSWENTEGERKYKTEIIANNVRFLDSKNNENLQKNKPENNEEEGDDDLPFN